MALKENNKKFLIIDGNKQYDIKYMAICILKWINFDINLIDIKINEIYEKMFVNLEEQIKLLEKHFAQI